MKNLYFKIDFICSKTKLQYNRQLFKIQIQSSPRQLELWNRKMMKTPDIKTWVKTSP